jgi:hypothetical protein
MLCKKLGKIIKKLGRLVEIKAKCLPLGHNKINFKHNGPQMSHRRACWRGYDGANALRWNLKVEPFVVRQVVQIKENMYKLGVVEDHMSL